MKNDNSINNTKDYDPSGDEEFYKNLSKAFSENDEEEEDINLDINSDDEFQWIDIEAAAKEGAERKASRLSMMNAAAFRAGQSDRVPSSEPDAENLAGAAAQDKDTIPENVPEGGANGCDGTEEPLDEEFEEELFANVLREAAAAIDGSEEAGDDEEVQPEAYDSEPEESYQKPDEEKPFSSYETDPVKEAERRRKEEDEILASINASLAAQVTSELGDEPPTASEEPDGKKPRKLRRILIPIVSVFLVLGCSFALLIGTSSGRSFLIDMAGRYAYWRINKDQGNTVETVSEFDEIEPSTGTAEGPTPTDTPDVDLNANEGTARREAEVINILLLGEEAIDAGGGRGRTDLMIIGTLDTRDGSVKLTSLMRDMLVAIPGYKDNKLNAAYTFGGVPLLYETIELNFDIELDGYILVNFESFEQIIDDLGGLELTLTRTESNYLNTTNYISNPLYRNTVAGTQLLNGNQVLGYCRVRYVPTGDNLKNDYGRTSRHRIVLNAIFDRYKSKSLVELALIMNNILPLLTTDLTQEQFSECLEEFVELHSLEMQELRLPADGAYDEGRVRGMSVLIPDLKKNVEVLHEFIYGDYEE